MHRYARNNLVFIIITCTINSAIHDVPSRNAQWHLRGCRRVVGGHASGEERKIHLDKLVNLCVSSRGRAKVRTEIQRLAAVCRTTLADPRAREIAIN